VTGCIAQKARLHLVRAEEPLHPRLLIEQERAHQMPITRFVELQDAVAHHREAEAVELQKAITPGCQAARVSRKEQ